MALLAYTCVSAGFVLMKKGIGWMDRKKERDRRFYWDLVVWATGFIIMNIYGVPSAVALKHLPAHIVAAFAGWGIIALVFLSRFLLKEKLFKTDYIFSLLIVAGIVLLNYFEKPVKEITVHIPGLVVLGVLPLVLFAGGLLNRWSGKVKTPVFAAASGISAGLMVISLRLLVLKHQYQVALYFGSPYLYMYIGFALLSFITLQAALRNGPMIVIGPVQYGANIIYPLFCTLVVFHRAIHPVQFLAVALIVYSVIRILKKH